MDEFNKIMLSPEPSRGIRLLDETGLLELFFPELTDLKGVENINGIKHKDNFLPSPDRIGHFYRCIVRNYGCAGQLCYTI